MTPNARWSKAVAERDRWMCAAQKHDPGCRGFGEHAHHINYKSQTPAATHFTVIENGVWVSNLCHTLAHKTHNGSIPLRRRHIASLKMRAEIVRLFPLHPELLLYVPLIEDAA